jgi:hypothetical protein
LAGHLIFGRKEIYQGREVNRTADLIDSSGSTDAGAGVDAGVASHR